MIGRYSRLTLMSVLHQGKYFVYFALDYTNITILTYYRYNVFIIIYNIYNFATCDLANQTLA